MQHDAGASTACAQRRRRRPLHVVFDAPPSPAPSTAFLAGTFFRAVPRAEGGRPSPCDLQAGGGARQGRAPRRRGRTRGEKREECVDEGGRVGLAQMSGSGVIAVGGAARPACRATTAASPSERERRGASEDAWRPARVVQGQGQEEGGRRRRGWRRRRRWRERRTRRSTCRSSRSTSSSTPIRAAGGTTSSTMRALVVSEGGGVRQILGSSPTRARAAMDRKTVEEAAPSALRRQADRAQRQHADRLRRTRRPVGGVARQDPPLSSAQAFTFAARSPSTAATPSCACARSVRSSPTASKQRDKLLKQIARASFRLWAQVRSRRRSSCTTASAAGRSTSTGSSSRRRRWAAWRRRVRRIASTSPPATATLAQLLRKNDGPADYPMGRSSHLRTSPATWCSFQTPRAPDSASANTRREIPQRGSDRDTDGVHVPCVGRGHTLMNALGKGRHHAQAATSRCATT